MTTLAHPTQENSPALVLSDAFLRRLDQAGPRYTSYPTADRFVEAFGPTDYRRALWARAHGVHGAGGNAPLSVYVHIPFCESVCYYCACNKVITRHHDRAEPYLRALAQEVALHVEQLGRGQPVSQLHLGGGSPTFLSDDELASLMAMLRSAFTLVSKAEVSIEVDPRTVDAQRLTRLAELGFNRISFGVQDFDPQVQKAVHRVQSEEMVAGLMAATRELGFSVDQCRPDLRPAQAERGVGAPHGGGRGCPAARAGRAVCLCPPAAALQAAAPHRCRDPAGR